MTDPRLPRPGSDDLRALLEDAVADVDPGYALDAIQARTTTSPLRARRPWFYAAGGAVLATAAVVTAVALAGGGPAPHATPAPGPATGGPSLGSPSAVPSPSTSSSPSPGTVAGPAVPAYYVGETSHGPRLFREFHAVPTGDLEAQAVHEAVAVAPADPDYATLWPAGTDVNHVEMSGGTIVVDLGGAALHDRPAGMTADQAAMSVQQVIYTAQAAFQVRAPVRLLLDGHVTDQVLGVATSEPLAQGATDSTLAQVWVIDPAQGETVSSGFTVSGLAAAFEANVQWELVQGSTVVRHGFTTAQQCCTMAPYSFTVSAPPGDYTLVVHDENASGTEGPPPWQDSKDITIR